MIFDVTTIICYIIALSWMIFRRWADTHSLDSRKIAPVWTFPTELHSEDRQWVSKHLDLCSEALGITPGIVSASTILNMTLTEYAKTRQTLLKRLEDNKYSTVTNELAPFDDYVLNGDGEKVRIRTGGS